MKILITSVLVLLLGLTMTQASWGETGMKGYGTDNSDSEETINVVDSMEDTRLCPPKSIYGRSFAEEKKVALTFDDGPFEFFTDEVLDILKKHNVKATFFLLGKRMEEYPEIVKRIHDEGHTIGIHAYEHNNLKYESNEGMYYQIQKCQQIFDDILDVKPQLFRPPYGAITPEQVNYIFDKGITTMVWSVNSYDSYPDRNDLADIYDAVTNKVYPGAIVLFHDKSAADFPDEDYSNTVKILLMFPILLEYYQTI